ncbi:MAG: methionine gamma-lyase family protein, partial [Clostridia bacterium]|nr:methionine gamma-lyase family protein [Clostridia bacterium]
MTEIKNLLKEEYGLTDEVIELSKKAEENVKKSFSSINETAEYNQLKVMRAFSKNKVSEAHLGLSTGYGYDDLGRDTLEKIYSEVFGTEKALVRHSIVSGTHAICSCLFGILRPGDILVSATGAPYDTLEEIIGKRGSGNGSLKEWGIDYIEVGLTPDGKIDKAALSEVLKNKKVKMVELQRSKGYAWRQSYTVEELADAIDFIKNTRTDVVVMVDNCYGEFVQ